MSRRRERRPVSGHTNRRGSSEAAALTHGGGSRASLGGGGLTRGGSLGGSSLLGGSGSAAGVGGRPCSAPSVGLGPAVAAGSLARTRSLPALRRRRDLVPKCSINDILATKKRHLERRGSKVVKASAKAKGGSPLEKNARLEALIDSIAGSLRQRYTGKKSLRNVFLAWDENHDGVVDPGELEAIFVKCGCAISFQQARDICKYFGDADAEHIPYNGFIDLIFQEEQVEEVQQRTMIDQLSDRMRALGFTEEDIKRAKENKGHRVPIEEVVRRLKLKFQAKGSLGREFREIDDDKSGTVSVKELHEFLERQGLEVDMNDINELFEKFDRSHDGSIEYKEFINLVFPPKDIGAFTRLTPRSEDEEDDDRQERDRGSGVSGEHERTQRKETQVSFEHVETSDIADEVDKGVRTALVTARLRQNIANRLSKHFRTVASAFDAIDVNKDGRISYGEFKAAMLNLNLKFKERDADIFLRYIDQDGSGFVDYQEFKESIAGKFGAGGGDNQVLAFSSEDHGENGGQSDDRATKLKAHLNGSPDHRVSQLKTATVSNIGLAFSNRIPNTLETQRIKTKRKLFPNNNNNNSSSSNNSFNNKDKIATNRTAGHQAGARKSRFDVSELRKQLSVPNRSMHRPSHDTTYLIRPDPLKRQEQGVIGGYVYENGERGRFQPETQRQYNLSAENAYHKQPEVVRKRQLYQNKLQRRRALLEQHERNAQPAIPFDPDRRLKTILRHRINYHNRIDVYVKRDAERRQNAGW